MGEPRGSNYVIRNLSLSLHVSSFFFFIDFISGSSIPASHQLGAPVERQQFFPECFSKVPWPVNYCGLGEPLLIGKAKAKVMWLQRRTKELSRASETSELKEGVEWFSKGNPKLCCQERRHKATNVCCKGAFALWVRQFRNDFVMTGLFVISIHFSCNCKRKVRCPLEQLI